jgi:hypothetical protein
MFIYHWEIYHVIAVNSANNIFSVLTSILALYGIYITYPLMRLHVQVGGPWTPRFSTDVLYDYIKITTERG